MPLVLSAMKTVSPRTRIAIAVVAALVIAPIIAIATMPLGWLKPMVERRLAARFGAPVRIAALGREGVSLRPVIDVENIRAAQPAWVGRGDLAIVRRLRVRLHPVRLLLGRGDEAELLGIEGVRLNLFRDAAGRANWRRDGARRRSPSGKEPAIGFVRDAIVEYRDEKQKRHFLARATIDPVAGLAVAGSGEVDGAPVTLAVRGAPMRSGRPWPFEATIAGQRLAVHAAGRMMAPLRTGAMTLHIDARADDLKRLDRIIEAGLFGTQPVRFAADVRHGDDTWTVTKMKGVIGHSDLTGAVTARKVDGRTRLDGQVRFGHLTFEDLATDESNAKALARLQANGPRLVPNTRVNISKIDRTDGRVAIRVDRIVGGRKPSSLTDLDAVLTIDHRLLTVAPLRIGLKAGAITGRVVVDQQGGQPQPHVTLALDMRNSRIAALAGGGGGVDARLDARVRLAGDGSTIREAVGRSSGRIGVVARDGTLPQQIAALIGFDVGRGLTSGRDERAALRCAALRLIVRGGRGAVDPLIVDTSASQTHGTGTIVFPGETLDLRLTGEPKRRAALRLPGPVLAQGTIRAPKIVVPPETKSTHGILQALGRAIGGNAGSVASDAECAGLARLALGAG